MKAKHFMALCIGCISLLTTKGDDRMQGIPRMPSGNKEGVTANQAMIVERSDLRLIFCDASTLIHRIKVQECIIDKGPRGNAITITVGKGMALRNIMDILKLKGWKGGQPQIRIIKRNIITQSAIFDDIDSAFFDIESFLNDTVCPGDIVVIASKT